MSVFKRIALAFCCLILAFLFTVVILLFVPVAIDSGLHAALENLEMLPVYLIFAILGWLCALPFVQLFKDAEGYRAWLIVTIGTVVGPAFVFLFTIAPTRGTHIDWQADGFGIIMSLFIGFLTSAFYVIFLLLFTRKRLSYPPKHSV